MRRRNRCCEWCPAESARHRRWIIFIDGELIKCDGWICFNCAMDRETY